MVLDAAMVMDWMVDNDRALDDVVYIYANSLARGAFIGKRNTFLKSLQAIPENSILFSVPVWTGLTDQERLAYINADVPDNKKSSQLLFNVSEI